MTGRSQQMTGQVTGCDTRIGGRIGDGMIPRTAENVTRTVRTGYRICY